ncbi:hypothetical protein B9Q13_01505 [Candidatus Marsarchaeota G2 archaeon ECH_B_SAG-G16]|jgi:hypothetical protein|uniref:Uncharacterized protein n=4 Tax=Candidatus Marsarchaeota TaxID=1978152 RepID=A0A2R6AEY8_9ARCH|nr:MAG: hypothetical protein B9Q01_06805 [Candidatus Marsarchaeota G1 archaeon OSP_D]PSN84935.1 MAG: hypothetical protein B9Q02_08250 [Candidatus Marsarchaeota G1 archaeon BE_D]PSN87738.1 MAG: hypothetical protein B9Q00_07950 [Candidatus Marsarchaeota G1 archaeon OSP_C]PSO05598.1 MAG: hypothetical protein B9Q13_01505 [Candidatus Marsarchaeota G2 archaeon ECH_B_SAG-G16]
MGAVLKSSEFVKEVEQALADVIGSVSASVVVQQALARAERIQSFPEVFEELCNSLFGTSSGVLIKEVTKTIAKKRGIVRANISLKELFDTISQKTL